MTSKLMTVSEKIIDIHHPKVDDIDIEDIARGLSHLCRYVGQCPKFYSVAEHSLLVYQLVSTYHPDIDLKMWALLHDAPEAYMGDIAAPIKQLVKEFVVAENKIMATIAKKYFLEEREIPRIVKEYDIVARHIETDRMRMSSFFYGTVDKEYKDFKIYNYDPEKARIVYMNEFYKTLYEYNKKYHIGGGVSE